MIIHTTSTKCQYRPISSTLMLLDCGSLPRTDMANRESNIITPTATCAPWNPVNTKKVVPKMCLVAKPTAEGHITTRTFIPHDCHAAVGVLGAVTVATAAVTEGTVARRVARVPPSARKTFSVQHPSGEFTVVLEMSATNPAEVARALLLRTARLLMRGEVLIPRDIWPDHS